MGKRPETPMERLKSVALWQWGLLVIGAGLMSYLVTGLQATGGTSAEARGQALGRALASAVFIIAGIVLIIVHFARRRN